VGLLYICIILPEVVEYCRCRVSQVVALDYMKNEANTNKSELEEKNTLTGGDHEQ
jgi:hypothetical protein